MKIGVGDVVVATRDGGMDPDGLPFDRPVKGRTYRITGIYEMGYGLGCTLQGLDPYPYRGYFLRVTKRRRGVAQGWYFKPIETASSEWTETLYDLLRSRNHEHTT